MWFLCSLVPSSYKCLFHFYCAAGPGDESRNRTDEVSLSSWSLRSMWRCQSVHNKQYAYSHFRQWSVPRRKDTEDRGRRLEGSYLTQPIARILLLRTLTVREVKRLVQDHTAPMRQKQIKACLFGSTILVLSRCWLRHWFYSPRSRIRNHLFYWDDFDQRIEN